MRRRLILSGTAVLFLAGCSSRSETSPDAMAQTERDTNIQQVIPDIPEKTLPADKEQSFRFYRQVSLYGGKLKASIPVSFTEMTAENMAVKYPNKGNRPDIVFTNDKGSVNVAFTHIAMPTTQEDLPEVEKVLSQQLQSAHPLNFQSRIENINGADYVIFEFESPAADSKIYNLMFATDIDGKLLLGTFNCTEALRNEWQPKAKEILSSTSKG